jgi:hypothetical protein
MKIPRNEFKNVIKECLKELIAEGALNNVIAEMVNTQGIPLNMQSNNVGYRQNPMTADPRVQAAAKLLSKGGDTKLAESIFADSLQTVAEQNAMFDPNAHQMQDIYNQGMMGMNGQQVMPQQGYYQNNYQQPMMQQPMMPQQGYYQNNYQQPQQQPGMLNGNGNQPNNAGMNVWAKLAFNSPIKNRPPMSTGGAGGNNEFTGNADMSAGRFG